MNIRMIGVFLVWLLPCFGMVHNSEIKKDLAVLTQKLQALGLNKEERKGTVRFTSETLASLKDFAQRHGISDLNEALRLALSGAGEATGGPGPIPSFQPVPTLGPVMPPPPPPPAPPVAEVKTGPPVLSAIEEIVAGGKKLSHVGGEKKEYSKEEKLISDTEFLKAFDANTFEELLDNIRNLRADPKYLKKESIKEPIRLDQPINLDLNEMLTMSRTLLALLEKKNKVSLKQINHGYLKSYMFDPSLFDEGYFEKLNNLVGAESVSPKKTEVAYSAFKEIMRELINEAPNLDYLLDVIKNLPSNQKRIVVPLEKAKFLTLEGKDFNTFEALKNYSNAGRDENFVKELKKIVKGYEQEEEKIDTLLANYLVYVKFDSAVMNIFRDKGITSSREVYDALQELNVDEKYDKAVIQPLLKKLTALKRTPQKIYLLLKQRIKHSHLVENIEQDIRKKIEPYGLLVMLLKFFNKYFANNNDPQFRLICVKALKTALSDLHEHGSFINVIKKMKKKLNKGNETLNRNIIAMSDDFQKFLKKTSGNKESYKKGTINPMLNYLIPEALNALNEAKSDAFTNAVGGFIANAKMPGLLEKYNAFAALFDKNLAKAFA